MPDIADRLKNVSVSASVAMTQKARDLAAAGVNVIALSTGEPDFPTPPHATEAAYAAALGGDTRYPPTDGTPALRAAIARKFQRDNNLNYDVSQILTAGGAKQIIFNAMLATINPGDEVVIPTPSWISYADIVKFAGGIPVPVACPEENNFKPYPQDIDAAITPKTKWLLLNYPSNPTGSVAPRQELQAMGEVMLRHPGVWILTDDIYEHLIYDDVTFYTLAEVEPRLLDRVLTVNGVSKSYSMTGWRIGYAAGDARVISEMAKIQSQSTSNACSISQVAAQAALEGDQGFIQEMNAAFKQRHDFVVAALNDIKGIRCAPADGAFYCFFSVADAIAATPGVSDDVEFAAWLMEKAEVALVPGSAFGAPGYLRLSFATSMDNLKEAMRRLKAALG